MSAFRDLKLSRKLTLAFGGIVVAVAACNAAVYASNRAADDANADAAASRELISSGAAVLSAGVEAQNALRGLAATGEASFVEGYQGKIRDLEGALSHLRDIDQDPDDRDLLQAVDRALAEFKAEADRAVAQARDPGNLSNVRASLTQLARLTATRNAITALVAHEQRQLVDYDATDKRAEANSYVALAAGCILAIAISALMGWLLSRMIAAPVITMTDAMRKLAAGDHTVAIPASGQKDEIGAMAGAVATFKAAAVEKQKLEAHAAEASRQQAIVLGELSGALAALSRGDLTREVKTAFAPEYEKVRTDFNAAVNQLRDAMGNISANVHGIRTGAGEISQAADDLSRRTEQQAASLEETAAALDEITATVRKTADGAKQANQIVGEARQQAERSGEVVRETVSAMSAIEDSSKRIAQIIGVIDEIAFQTNLLALNAGVEAARAGEAGRGFAVVASEVRALAQRSSEAAKEIKTLINASSKHVDSGVDLVNRTGEALQEIVTRVEKITGLVAQMSASTQEQSTGLGQVNTAVNQMDQVTQQNAAMVEQSTAASHSLASEADALAELVSHFEIGGAAAPLARTPRAPAKRAAPVTVTPKRPVAVKAMPTHGATALKPRAETAEDDWEDF